MGLCCKSIKSIHRRSSHPHGEDWQALKITLLSGVCHIYGCANHYRRVCEFPCIQYCKPDTTATLPNLTDIQAGKGEGAALIAFLIGRILVECHWYFGLLHLELGLPSSSCHQDLLLGPPLELPFL